MMKIALLGDVALTGLYDCSQTNEVFERVELIKRLISDCDYAICNLESPLTRKKKTYICKGAYIKADPENIEVLKRIGITHVTLANNHIFDYGKQGAKETISILEKNGIQYCGLCNEPLFISKGEDRVLLDGFCCYSANGVYYGNKPLSTNLLCYDYLKKFLSEARGKECLPIASVHFGIEGLHYPAIEHINLFHKLSDEFSFVLHGNHTHSIQGFENYKNSILIYSQGNLLFDDVLTTSIGTSIKQNDETRKTYFAKLEISKQKVNSMETFAIQFDNSGYPKLCSNVEKELQEYCDAIANNMDEISGLRKDEKCGKIKKREPRNIGFFVHRLNVKYIGAYINGKIHAQKYRKAFRSFFD